MSFGIQLTNSAGDQLILGNEEAYLYWGKVTYTTTSTAAHDTTLFNMPASLRALALVHVNTTADVMAYICYVNNTLTLRTGRRSGTVVTAYVFVPAKDVPLGSYGIAVWNDNNILAFHNTRPPLKLKGLYTGPVTTGYKTAVLGAVYSVGRYPDGGLGGSVVKAFNVVGHNTGNRLATVLDYWEASPPAGPITVSPKGPYIDASYYDQYTSLGDYT